MKKCNDSFICVNPIVLFVIIIIITCIIYYFSKKHVNIYNKQIQYPVSQQQEQYLIQHSCINTPSYPYNNLPDVLLNPYVPPVKDERYFVQQRAPLINTPINVSTNIGAVNTSYRQVGILTPLNKNSNKNNILPLMGRPIFINRNKWQYYTMSDQKNSVKLEITKNGRLMTNEYGVDALYSNDIVQVNGYNEKFNVYMYDNNGINYIPYL